MLTRAREIIPAAALEEIGGLAAAVLRRGLVPLHHEEVKEVVKEVDELRKRIPNVLDAATTTP